MPRLVRRAINAATEWFKILRLVFSFDTPAEPRPHARPRFVLKVPHGSTESLLIVGTIAALAVGLAVVVWKALRA